MVLHKFKKVFSILIVLLVFVNLIACKKTTSKTNSDNSSIVDISSQENYEDKNTEDTTSEPTSENVSGSTNTTTSNESFEINSSATNNNNKTNNSVDVSSTPKPNVSSKPIENVCNHNTQYVFDNIENSFSHSEKCTLCKEYINKNITCQDTNNDYKCDMCSSNLAIMHAAMNDEGMATLYEVIFSTKEIQNKAKKINWYLDGKLTNSIDYTNEDGWGYYFPDLVGNQTYEFKMEITDVNGIIICSKTNSITYCGHGAVGGGDY